MSQNKTVLVVGGGGREHALAWRLLQSPDVTRVLLAPGNGGTANEPGMENVRIAVDDFDGLGALVREHQVSLTVVGPEVPLALGITDYFRTAGLRCFGPDKKSAQLESSKSFAKAFLNRHNIATARAASFHNMATAEPYIRKQKLPLVIKADGLAAGKGVVIAETADEAVAAGVEMLSLMDTHQQPTILVEEHLVGEEASFIIAASGEQYVAFATSQDHKRAFDHDLGPNTGGMGAYSPAPVITDQLHRKIERDIVAPTLAGMVAEGMPYTGFLYVGLMITETGEPLVLEFNCRFGDPEAQPVLLRLQSDLYHLCKNAIDGTLENTALDFDQRPALGIVMATTGYPGKYEQGLEIQGLERIADNPECKVFHAGTRQTQESLITAGGRVFCVTALGESFSEAQVKAYGVCEQILWPGAFYRRDIGARAID